MESKLKFKIELQYSLESKKIVFYKEICNDGLTTKSISIDNNKVVKKTLNSRILSGECLFEGNICGYSYVYDKEGKTIDLKQIKRYNY